MKPANGVCFKMNNALFDEKEAGQYLSIFGEDKMGCLWQEFLQDTTETLESIESQDREDIRLKFHSWRSSAKVFGLKSFVQQCENIENMTINGENIENIKKTIDNCKKIFHNAQKEANRFFKRCSYGKNSNAK